MARNYLIKCRKCKWWFYSSNPKAQYHPKCRPEEKKIYKRTKKFYKLRYSVILRDEHTCQECGYDFRTNTDRELHVHHMNGKANDDRMDNLITVCNKCHRKIHAYGLKDFELEDFEVIPDPEPLNLKKGMKFKNIPKL